MDDRQQIEGNLFLIGFMGVGKSTVTKKLCEYYGAEFVEMDQRIEESEKRPITQIFAQEGEPYFRKLETELLKSIQTSSGFVVSCGGGVVVTPVNVDIMKENGKIIWLTATPETVFERVRYSKERPILNDHMNVEYIASLMEKRHTLYAAAADLVIATDGKDADRICQEIVEKLTDRDKGNSAISLN